MGLWTRSEEEIYSGSDPVIYEDISLLHYLLYYIMPVHFLITTGDGFFAECPRLCRVFFIGHSVKRLFTECQRESTRQTTGTRQRVSLPSAENSSNNNTRQRGYLPSVGHSANQNTRQRAAVVNGRQPPLTLCLVSSPDTRQSGDLPSVIFGHSANHIFFHF